MAQQSSRCSGVAAFYRNGYRSQLVPQWIPALEGVEERLRRGGRVCDVGCGHGISTGLMAEAYPHSSFWGVDLHPASVEAARAHAEERGVEDRVTFQVGTGQTYKMRDLDLVCFFDCLHDLGDPEGAARHAAGAPTEGGTVMLVEPFAGDAVETPFNLVIEARL